MGMGVRAPERKNLSSREGGRVQEKCGLKYPRGGRGGVHTPKGRKGLECTKTIKNKNTTTTRNYLFN